MGDGFEIEVYGTLSAETKHAFSASGFKIKYFDTKFIKINAPDAPFFVDKLQIQVLPCIIFFRNGVAFDRIVGFEELGANDDFPTEKLERMLLNAGIVAVREKKEDDSEDEEETMKLERAKRITYGFTKYDSEDEDSDFD